MKGWLVFAAVELTGLLLVLALVWLLNPDTVLSILLGLSIGCLTMAFALSAMERAA